MARVTETRVVPETKKTVTKHHLCDCCGVIIDKDGFERKYGIFKIVESAHYPSAQWGDSTVLDFCLSCSKKALKVLEHHFMTAPYTESWDR